MTTDDARELEFHPIAQLYPLMDGESFARLREDIAAYGQREPIWLHPDGRILDGRNRYIACRDLGVEPVFRQWTGTGGVIAAAAFVRSLNSHRRHLSSSQQAAVAVKLDELVAELEREARERQRQGTRTERPAADLPETFPEGPAPVGGEVREQLAGMFRTNPHYVSDAARLRETAPDLFDQVHAGEMSIPQARRVATARARRETPPLPPGNAQYRVLYADPPWPYNDSGIIGDDIYGRAGRHYPTMSLEAIAALPVRELAGKDAVLFLWVPAPLIESAFPVIRAWGFLYKAQFIWDKVRHNYGHYNSVRHELLLICTRGSCTPDAPEQIDSVQTIERSPRHSEKPAAFREIIDRLYPHGRRLELFARPGAATEIPATWETWGNEPDSEPDSAAGAE